MWVLMNAWPVQTMQCNAMQTEFQAPGHVIKISQVENRQKFDKYKLICLGKYRY